MGCLAILDHTIVFGHQSTHETFTYGGFLKWGYLKIIHFSIFDYKPSILGVPQFRKPLPSGKRLHNYGKSPFLKGIINQ